jgi:molybdopterin/thiamine biosynthesis adenylyltransferase
MKPRARSRQETRRVVIVGAGGNIGSQLVPHIARMRGVDAVTLIDPDTYKRKNVATQNIAAAEVGLPKVEAQRRRIAAIGLDKDVAAIQDEVERVPVSLLRGTVMLSCLDSRRGRQYMNWASWRLGVPWIDSGVQADGLLARVSVYLPGPDAPCLECGWSQEDYRQLEQTYPCGGGSTGYATNAPAYLGALAASIQANECEKLLEGRWNSLCRNQEILIDGLRYKTYVTSLRSNPDCRMDHRTWTLECLDGDAGELTLEDVVRWAVPRFDGATGGMALSVENAGFVMELACMRGCSNRTIPRRLTTRIPEADRRCAACSELMQPVGLRIEEALALHEFSVSERATSLRSLGMQGGDVFRIACGEKSVDVQLSESA